MPDSWDDDKPRESAQTCAPGSWLDNLFITGLKTAAVGTGAPGQKICVPYMVVGECPICHERVERPKDDMFFPYCGYNHKRIVQREEERQAREEFEQDYYHPYETVKANKRRHNATYRRRKKLIKLKERLEQAQETYSEISKQAEEAPIGSKERVRLNAKVRWWYLNVMEIQKQIKEVEAQLNEKSTVQGHRPGRANQDARAGHDESGDCGLP